MNNLLSIQDKVSGWGQSFVHPPPPPIELIVDHMDRQAYVSFCLALLLSVKGFQNLFSHLFPFALSSWSFIWRFVPSALLG